MCRGDLLHKLAGNIELLAVLPDDYAALLYELAVLRLELGGKCTDTCALDDFQLYRTHNLRVVVLGIALYIVAQMPKDLNISSEDENFSTRPASLSSCERR